MRWLIEFYKSTIGMKVVMALTGIILVGFVIVHMLGNLQIYAGAEALNSYAAALQANPPLVWAVRITLLGSVLLHIASAVMLTMRSRAARPAGYNRKTDVASTFASRTLRLGGLVLFAFIVYHLLHFTVGSVHPTFRSGDVYGNVVSGFRVPLVAAWYIVAQVLLGLHLYHGIYSLTRSLGFTQPRFARIAQGASLVIGVGVALGNVSIPLSVLLGFVG